MVEARQWSKRRPANTEEHAKVGDELCAHEHAESAQEIEQLPHRKHCERPKGYALQPREEQPTIREEQSENSKAEQRRA